MKSLFQQANFIKQHYQCGSRRKIKKKKHERELFVRGKSLAGRSARQASSFWIFNPCKKRADTRKERDPLKTRVLWMIERSLARTQRISLHFSFIKAQEIIYSLSLSPSLREDFHLLEMLRLADANHVVNRSSTISNATPAYQFPLCISYTRCHRCQARASCESAWSFVKLPHHDDSLNSHSGIMGLACVHWCDTTGTGV